MIAGQGHVIVGLPGEPRIYASNIPARNRRTCLKQNRQYRIGVADGTSGYYYPAQLGMKIEH